MLSRCFAKRLLDFMFVLGLTSIGNWKEEDNKDFDPNMKMKKFFQLLFIHFRGILWLYSWIIQWVDFYTGSCHWNPIPYSIIAVICMQCIHICILCISLYPWVRVIFITPGSFTPLESSRNTWLINHSCNKKLLIFKCFQNVQAQRY